MYFYCCIVKFHELISFNQHVFTIKQFLWIENLAQVGWSVCLDLRWALRLLAGTVVQSDAQGPLQAHPGNDDEHVPSMALKRYF